MIWTNRSSSGISLDQNFLILPIINSDGISSEISPTDHMSRGQGWAPFLHMAMEATDDTHASTYAAASHHSASGSSRSQSQSQSTSTGQGHANLNSEPNFDLEKWFPSYQSCQIYFINHAQYSVQVQAVAAFANIRLPFQHIHNPITTLPNIPAGPQRTSTGHPTSYGGMPHASSSSYHTPLQNNPNPTSLPFVSLVPYIRRLIVTGFDQVPILHGFFGTDWRAGIGHLHEIERRNYMFVSKSVPWGVVKKHYDMPPDETAPFLKPLQRTQLSEIEKGEKHWSEWLAMEDWMLGPRAPEEGYAPGPGRAATEDVKSDEMMGQDHL